MLLRLPSSLHYPITVTTLVKQPGDAVEREEALFWYFYQTTVTEGDRLGNKYEVKKKYPTKYEATVDGEVVQWKIAEGDIIDGPIDFVEIDEPCAHEVQFGGLCAECGKDMTVSTYDTEFIDAMRATITMTHENTALTVSEREAMRVEEDAKRSLLMNRKLSLVVDLDQTIIHTTVDPTVDQWMKDQDNPNHQAVSDVRVFEMVEHDQPTDAEGIPQPRSVWYFVKLRPGLESFLHNISEMFELHIYTMGTRPYAQHIAAIIDPDRKLFGDRILSRDESGSLTAKNLHRLFPVDTKMVVIIDDRGDVWRWSPNLIKVVPYDFFVGIGDINSSFLPKKQELITSSKSGERAAVKAAQDLPREQHVNGAAVGAEGQPEMSALEQLVTMGGGDDPRILQEQSDAQIETIMHQVEDRPLLQKQKELDAEEDVAESSDSSSSVDESTDMKRHKHLLQDNDRELFDLEVRLEQVHRNFFDEYDRRRSRALGGRVAALRGEKTFSKEKDVDLKLVPDIKEIMPAIKRRVLSGVVMAFTGVLPLNIDTHSADISLWSKSFGATITTKISSRVTHLVAGRNRTAKVRAATRYPHIKIVRTHWLNDCLTQWKRLDEEPYLLPVHPDDREAPIQPGEEMESSWQSSEEGTGVAGTEEDEPEMTADILKSSGLTEVSPIGYDADQQAAIHEELKEFLGSDDDSESDSDASFMDEVPTTAPSRKRKRSDDTKDEEGEGDEGGKGAESGSDHGSRLSQRIRRVYERPGTALSQAVSSAANSESPSSELEDPTDAATASQQAAAMPAPEEEDDELEREMMAAFEDGDYDETAEEKIAEEHG
ncbi:protein-serine/threonine phosphatase [Aspergillus saccharolyticus JOP 1030-1]|uniref:RNA polymerase II subunit A C-terminal domain phosphatase n=1 Tax=Aspergillus saccharolyticus JOP 1030-1 TaxID=1450539 RepID=A0A318ZGD2_9EURO|nr:hypothetical protein BP01DRAFT_40552 [Aspergillus saccharolyticus JOP 1030-1]PYH45424.1 hypothetical protein BP01DRAFT_40552 [Aspergillus saccharolyticus JOP 1030-1]